MSRITCANNVIFAIGKEWFVTALTSCAFFPNINLPFSLYPEKRLGHYCRETLMNIETPDGVKVYGDLRDRRK